MKTLTQRIRQRLQSNRTGLLLFAAASIATLFLTSMPEGVSFSNPLTMPVNNTGEVQVQIKPSQTKFVQGGANTLYLDVSIKTPVLAGEKPAAKATDMIIVLDRSGSMAEESKMPYAKAAIQDVLSRLHEQDRFALVSFSDDAIVHSPLLPVSTAQRENLSGMLNTIMPSGGTNMGEGVAGAINLLSGNSGERTRKVLLLSDGQANQGIVQPEALAQLATQLTQKGAVLSAIGMGLDFNEVVMTQMADHGMGHYAFLENLAGLGQILNDDLNAARAIYASSSALDFKLGEGVQVLDAGGYPLAQNEPGLVRISSGQLLSGENKHFVISMTVPAQRQGQFPLGELTLNYQMQGKDYRAAIDSNLQVSVVEPEKRQEALSSIDDTVYKASWLQNNLGVMQKKLGAMLRDGKKDEAEKTINEYHQALQAAEAESKVPLASPALAGKLESMRADVLDAFKGDSAEQDVKRKRAAKTMQYGSLQEQRTAK